MDITPLNKSGIVNSPLPQGAISKDPVHSFERTLSAAFHLWKNFSSVNFLNAELERTSLHPTPYLIIGPDNCPQIGIGLNPTNNGSPITSDFYYAPLHIKKVSTWKETSKVIGNIEVNGYRGVKEEYEMFSRKLRLSELLQGDLFSKAVQEKTKVVNALGLLPIAQDSEFETEFSPIIMLKGLDHHYYYTYIICQDRVNYISQITEGNSIIELKDINEKKEYKDWRAGFVNDLSTLERAIFIPNSAGRMILISFPYEKITDYRSNTTFEYNPQGETIIYCIDFKGVRVRQESEIQIGDIKICD